MNGELRQRRINNVSNINCGGKQALFATSEGAVAQERKSDMPLVHESCNCSGFTMAAVGASVLMFLGIIVYALVI